MTDLIRRGERLLSPSPLLCEQDRAQEYGGREDVIGPKSDYMPLADPIDRRRVSSNAASKNVNVRRCTQQRGAAGYADGNRIAFMALHLARGPR